MTGRRTVLVAVAVALFATGCGNDSGEQSSASTGDSAAAAARKRAKQKADYRDFTHEANVLKYWGDETFMGPLVTDVKVHRSVIRLETSAKDDARPSATPDIAVLCNGTLDTFPWARRVVVPSASGKTIATGRRGGRCTVR